MYARSDITALAKGNSYSRLQWEEVTVGQALALAQQPAQSSHTSSSPVSSIVQQAVLQRVIDMTKLICHL